jgi:ADP-ribosylglycohydrolase
MSTLTQSKVEGMFLGIAYGDALGMPFEGWSRAEIKAKVPSIADLKYFRPDGHKYFDGNEAGTTTDDWSLTGLTAEALIEAGTFCMDSVAKHHCRAIAESPTGMGNTTKDAILRLIAGESWRESGKYTDGKKRGLGNGVLMKVSSLAAWYISPIAYGDPSRKDFYNKIVSFGQMTHDARVAVMGGVIHTAILVELLRHSSVDFDPYWDFVDVIDFAIGNCEETDAPEGYTLKDVHDTGHDIEFEMVKLRSLLEENWTDEQLDEEFGRGTYPVLHSLPFSYAHFIRKPKSVEAMFEAALAGGDTDSNASFVGGMLGALNGRQIFDAQPWLREGLKDYEKVMRTAEAFCSKFSVPAV